MIADIPTGAWIVYVGALVGALSTLTYAMATARGELAPSRASWGVWTATAGIGTVSAITAGGGVGAIVSGAVFVRCASVLVATFIPRWRGITVQAEPHSPAQQRLDMTCLGTCGLISLVWVYSAWTSNPAFAVVALLAAITVDGVAGVPTGYHAWQRQESATPFLLGLVNPVIGLLVIQEWTVQQWSWPIWEITICSVIAVIALLREAPSVDPAPAAVGVSAPVKPPKLASQEERMEIRRGLHSIDPDDQPYIVTRLARDVIAGRQNDPGARVGDRPASPAAVVVLSCLLGWALLALLATVAVNYLA